MDRRAYPSDIDDDAYTFLLPYLALTPEDAPQRKYPYRNLIQSAFIAEAIVGGFSMTVAFLDEARPESFLALRRAFLGRQFGGVVMVGAAFTPQRLEEFTQWKMPTVLFDFADPAGSLPSVTGDFAGGMAHLVAYHVAQGRQNLALVLPSSDSGSSATLRRQGFVEAAIRHGVTYQLTDDRPTDGQFTDSQLTDGAWSSEAGERAFRQLWTSAQRPDAVVCGNDRMAAGALLEARNLGVKVPQDVAVSGFDDFEFARYTTPALTTVHVPHGEMARRAVRMLIERLEPSPVSNPLAAPALQMPVTLVVRESA